MPRRLSILHVSDLHERVATPATKPERRERIRRGAASRDRVLGDKLHHVLSQDVLEIGPLDYVCFTGDLADWGLPEEYDRATARLDGLLSTLKLDRSQLIAVPGNHDINRYQHPDVWQQLRELCSLNLDSVSEWMAGGKPPYGAKSEWREQILEREQAFWRWLAGFRGSDDALPERSPHQRLGFRYTPQKDIHFLGLDSAWLAGDDHDAGHLALTSKQLSLLSTDSEGRPLTGLRIALVHHPLTDLGDGRHAATWLPDYVDLLLHGHQHDPRVQTTTTPDRSFSTLAAGSLFEGDREERWLNGFHRIDIDLNDCNEPQRYDVTFYGWSTSGHHWHRSNEIYASAKNGTLTLVPAQRPSTRGPSVTASLSPGRSTFAPPESAPFDFSMADAIRLETVDDARTCSDLFECIATARSAEAEEFKTPKPIGPLELARYLAEDRGAVVDLQLRGAQGLGKSTFLAALKAIFERGIVQPAQPIKIVYVDASKFQGVDKPQEATTRRIIEIEQEHVNSKSALIVMVDRLSRRGVEYSRAVCEGLLDRITQHDRVRGVIWSLTDGFEEELHTMASAYRALRDWRQIVVSFEAFDTRRANFDALLARLQWMSHRLQGRTVSLSEQNAQPLRDRLRDLAGAAPIDVQIAAMVYAKLDDKRYDQAQSIAHFFRTYCSEEIEKLTDVATGDLNSRLEAAGDLAFRAVIQSFYRRERAPTALAIKRDERRGAAWAFLNEHRNILDYMCSSHLGCVIRQARDPKKALALVDKGALAFDFPRSINSFLLGVVSTYNDREKREFQDGCRAILAACANPSDRDPSQVFQARNFIYYLLGRVSPLDGKTLANALQTIQERLLVPAALEDDAARVALKTERRTLFVSLMRLNRTSRAPGDRYLAAVVSEPEEASIDRGYHRIYYGDRQALKDEGPLQYLDDKNGGWTKSFEALRARLDEDLGLPHGSLERAKDALPQVEVQHRIFTLVSFVQSRLQIKGGITDEQLVYARKVVDTALQFETELCPEVADHLKMMSCDLSRGDISVWRLVFDLYRLKWEPRRGWLARGLEKQFVLGRIESVADHNYFTRLLVELLLPEKLEDKTYAKAEVARLVLFHDLGEALTGDFIRYGAAATREKMLEKERLSMQYLRFKETYDDVFGTIGIFNDWARFASSSDDDINATIAHDIDRLENYLQLIIYRQLFPGIVDAAFYDPFAKSVRDAKSRVVRGLIASLESWLAQHTSEVCRWPDQFRDPALLAREEGVVMAEGAVRAR